MSDSQNCYLLDTSVILDDPINILRISENNENIVAITDVVLAELNNKKDDMRSATPATYYKYGLPSVVD